MIPDVESDYELRMLDRSAVPSKQFDNFDKSSILRDPACPDEHLPAFAGRIELVVAAELVAELVAAVEAEADAVATVAELVVDGFVAVELAVAVAETVDGIAVD